VCLLYLHILAWQAQYPHMHDDAVCANQATLERFIGVMPSRLVSINFAAMIVCKKG
jgi:hypothetical protein